MSYFLMLIIILIVHQIALGLAAYRWLIGCLTFPWDYYKLKKQLSRSTDIDVVDLFWLWDSSDYWFLNHWFGRRLKKVIELEILKRDN